MQELASHIITRLADGQFHTGDELGASGGVSKTSVWKAVNTLERYGLVVHSVRGKGYRLSEPLTLLQEALIRKSLPAQVNARLSELSVHSEIESTNTWLLQKALAGEADADTGTLRVCLSEMQSAGKGRRGRQWVSPFGQNIYMSVLKGFNVGAAQLGGLSLVTGIAVMRALQHWSIRGIGLKWPNDIYCQGAKLGGVLLEISGDLQSSCQVVTGLGLNVLARPELMQDIAQPWTDLHAHGFAIVQRNLLVARLLEALVEVLDQFQRGGFHSFRDEWHAVDLSYGKPVQISSDGQLVEGTGLGVDDGGALLMQVGPDVRRFQGGEVSLRVQLDSALSQTR